MTWTRASYIQRTILTPLVVGLLAFSLQAQASGQDLSRRPLEHRDYDVWNTMSQYSLSDNGAWVMYTTQSGAIEGEAALHIRSLKKPHEYSIERGGSAQFTFDSRYAVFRVTPEPSKIKQLRKEKAPPESMPAPKLQILELDSGRIQTIENLLSFKLPEENGNWVACLLSSSAASGKLEPKKAERLEVFEVTTEGLRRSQPPLKLKSREQLARERGEQERAKHPSAKETSEKENATHEKPDESDKKKFVGKSLMLINLSTGIQRVYPAVSSYEFSENGRLLCFATSIETEEESKSESGTPAKESEQAKVGTAQQGPVDGVHVVELASLKRRTIMRGTGQYKGLSLSKQGTHLAFLSNRDDFDAKSPTWSLYLWNAGEKRAMKVAAEEADGVPTGWWVSPNASLRFSEDERRLFFDTAPIPEEVIKQRIQSTEKAEEADEEKAKLDIWHWRDPLLQPQQLLQAESERNRDYRAVYNLASKKLVQLATRQIPNIRIDYRSTSNFAVASTNMQYRKMLSWDMPGFQDTYLVHLANGKKQLVLEEVKWEATLSPQSKYLIWFDRNQRKWFAKSTKHLDRDPVEMSRGIRWPLQDELHDTPNLPSAYGTAGWLVGDQGVLIYDQFDIWQLDPSGKHAPLCLTNGIGRKEHLRFRYRALDAEQRAIAPDQPLILEAFDRKTKASGYYTLTLGVKHGFDSSEEERSLEPLMMLDERVSGLRKAKSSDTVVFTRSTFRMCPDLWSSNLQFQNIARVSNTNPQQDNYTWGDAELVHWDSATGEPLDGILLKPDGFDPEKKYPMMVYFYERNSDNLHAYYPPAAGRSIICHSFYVSRGYLVFIPDIPYETGAPVPAQPTRSYLVFNI